MRNFSLMPYEKQAEFARAAVKEFGVLISHACTVIESQHRPETKIEYMISILVKMNDIANRFEAKSEDCTLSRRPEKETAKEKTPMTDEDLIDRIIALKNELRQRFDPDKQVILYRLIDQLENNDKRKNKLPSNN